MNGPGVLDMTERLAVVCCHFGGWVRVVSEFIDLRRVKLTASLGRFARRTYPQHQLGVHEQDDGLMVFLDSKAKVVAD
jgi:hypothetical protein